MSRCVLLAALVCSAAASRTSEDVATRQQLKQQVLSLIISCEELCKSLNSQLPKGHFLIDETCAKCRNPNLPAGDLSQADSCYEKMCHPPSEPCPSEEFLECVKANSQFLQVSTLPEVPALIQAISNVQKVISSYVNAIP